MNNLFRKRKIPARVDLQDILLQIEQADDTEISEIIQAVIRRYKTVFPDWEVVFLSLPLEPAARTAVLEQTIEQLWKT